MSYLSSQAVILRKFKLGESDSVVTFLTRDYGTLKAVAKGAVKSKKRFGGVLLTGNHVTAKIFIKKKTTLHRLESADMVEHYHPLSEDPVLFAAASHLLELSAAYSVPNVGDTRQFALLVSSLRALSAGGLDEKLLRIFELRTLAYAGVAPNFDHCGHCGKPPANVKAAWFSFSTGTILCGQCAPGPDAIRIEQGTRRLFSEVVHVESRLLPRLVFTRNDLAAAKQIIPSFCEYNLSRKLRSLRMMYRLIRTPPASNQPNPL